MSISSYELVEVTQDNVTADLIVWNRYRKPSYGIVEAMLDYNPQLAIIHQTTPFIPPGTMVMIPIDLTILQGGSTSPAPSNLWGGGNA